MMKSHYRLECVSFFAVIRLVLLETDCSVYIEAIRHGLIAKTLRLLAGLTLLPYSCNFKGFVYPYATMKLL